MDLEYTIKRSLKRKKLTITVERDRTVVVRAPEQATDEEVRRIVKAVDGVQATNALAVERMGHIVRSLRTFGRPDRSEVGPLELGDALTVDRAGNVYCAGPKAVWIWSPQGKLLDKIVNQMLHLISP